MSNSNWPEAVAVSSVSAAFALILTPWERIGPLKWDALSTIATFAAVLVALGVPIWQNIDRKREARRSKLELELRVALEAERALQEGGGAVDKWVEEKVPPPTLTLETRIDELSGTRLFVTSVEGARIVSRVLNLLRRTVNAVNAASRDAAQCGGVSPGEIFRNLELYMYMDTQKQCRDWQIRLADELGQSPFLPIIEQ